MTDEQERYESVDLPFYRDEVSPVLPPRLLDFHAHSWRSAHRKKTVGEVDVPGTGYMISDKDYPVERLLADAARIFPDREYEAVCFGNPTPTADPELTNAYAAEVGKRPGIFPLMLAGRELGVPRETLAREIEAGGFFGYKVFMNWIGDDYGEKTIEEMLSPNEMELADELGLVVLLHVPRSGRLADPEVARGVRRLARDYPNARVVLAHCGRCYLAAEMRKAVGSIRDLPNVYMDTAMVMDATALEIAIDTLGPARLLFATDFPVAAMRGRRVRVMDHWVDVVLERYPESAYRVRSDAIRATFMALEIVIAIRDAAERVGVSGEELRAIFYENGMNLLRHVMGGERLAQRESNRSL